MRYLTKVSGLIILVFMVLFVAHFDLAGASAGTDEAIESYHQGIAAKTIGERERYFEKALELYLAQYNTMKQDGAVNGLLCYNIGNCYFNLEQNEQAIFYYQLDKTVMLVDDEPIILKTMAIKLKDEGFTVISAANGTEALELLPQQTIHMVITDLMMEGMDGLEVLKNVKKFNQEIAVIILTGYGELTSAIEALRLGAEDYLLKPCDLNELLFRMFKCFEKQSLKEIVQLYEDILPICLDCKKIRDDSHSEPGQGEWLSVEKYLTRKAGKNMSHGYCPDCGKNFLSSIDKHFKK